MPNAQPESLVERFARKPLLILPPCPTSTSLDEARVRQAVVWLEQHAQARKDVHNIADRLVAVVERLRG
jgi:hypothetical protein